MSKYVKEVPAPNKSMINTHLTTCVLVVARYFKELWQGLTSENLLRNFQFSWHAIKQGWKETLIMCRIDYMERRLTNSNYCTNSTFTWDPKWTQTGLRFHFGVKFHFGVSELHYQRPHDFRRGETHFGANFTSVNLTEVKFQTAVNFPCNVIHY